jgi:hypothetical protein
MIVYRINKKIQKGGEYEQRTKKFIEILADSFYF